MKWSLAARYQILLRINNAVISQTSKSGFFENLTTELRKHFSFDNASINLYDEKTRTLSFFTAEYGISVKEISKLKNRPLSKGTIARMVIMAGEPIIIDDLTKYADQFSIKAMLKHGIISVMAFPLIVRKKTLGTLHFTFKNASDLLPELSEMLEEVSQQVAFAVEVLLTYTKLKEVNATLKREKNYLLGQSETYRPDTFFYSSPVMEETMALVHQVAETDVPVLITGETGTGKDYIARHIHNLSLRRDHLFVKINCPALVTSLFESELFGHSKGAFTGADTSRHGRFEVANKGTVFLDEVSEMSANLQAKLLQVLQEKRFERVGSSKSIDVDFRIIAATNENLEQCIEEGTFRKDFYYRLNIFNIHVPPLRERAEDIPILIRHITKQQAEKMNRPVPIYSDEAIELLCGYPWPGNVRELKNIVKRFIILFSNDTVTPDKISSFLQPTQHENVQNSPVKLADVERLHIEQVLIKCRGVVGGPTGAAKLLGVPRTTLQYRLKKYDINPSDYTH